MKHNAGCDRHKYFYEELEYSATKDLYFEGMYTSYHSREKVFIPPTSFKIDYRKSQVALLINLTMILFLMLL